MSPALLEVSGLKKSFAVGGGLLRRRAPMVRAVDDVTFEVRRGEVLGLVGESGSGKSTLGRSILRLNKPDAGSIRFDGQEIAGMSRRQMRPIRQRMQMVFQDPFASLNPRMTVEQLVGAPLIIQGLERSAAERRERVVSVLRRVGLAAEHVDRFPHEFSGGQRQRIGIARALISLPSLIVADEPVAALDVSVQAQIVNLLLDLSTEFGLTILFITHDFSVVGRIADRVAVMYLGRIVELADTAALFASPAHPYTEALLSAIPVPDPTRNRTRIILEGAPPSPLDPPSGCAFRTRCRYAVARCAGAVPKLREVAAGHFTACIRDGLELQPAD